MSSYSSGESGVVNLAHIAGTWTPSPATLPLGLGCHELAGARQETYESATIPSLGEFVPEGMTGAIQAVLSTRA